MELIEIPHELLPVLRRWREERSGLSYLAGSHIIVLQEDLPLAETVFVMYHEAVHSRLFNCALGFLITTLAGFEAQLAVKGLELLTAGLNESLLPDVGQVRSGFFSRRPSRPSELGEIPPEIRVHATALCETDKFRTLILSYLQIRRRISTLVNEWRLPHEGLATLSEVAILREVSSVEADIALWANVLGVDPAKSDLEDSIRRRIEIFLRILQAPETELISPERLIEDRGLGLDPYIDGARFLYHQFDRKMNGLDSGRAACLASQIPYGILPGLDESLSEFEVVALNACSPTVRLGRIAAALQAGQIVSPHVQDVLPFALPAKDRDSAATTAGYYSWEQKALHGTKFIDPDGPIGGETDLPYGLTSDQFLYNREPTWNIGNVWVIYNNKALVCSIDHGFRLSPVEHTEKDQQELMIMLHRHFITQGFERLAENLISWRCLLDDNNCPVDWV